MILVTVLFVSPFYFVLVNSFKPFGEILTNAASIPSQWMWQNYQVAFERVAFLRVFGNSLFITSVSLVLLVITGSAAAWWIVRNRNWFTLLLFYVFVIAMITPFQSFMIPLMRLATTLGLLNSRFGLILVYLGFSAPFTVFLYHGYIRSVPIEIEESGIIDGCNPLQLFVSLVHPLIKPITITVVILQTLLIWNDFLLPLLFLSNRSLHTIPLAIFSFFGQYTNRWDYALATLVLGMIPILAFSLALQKYIVDGIRTGAVKG